MRAATSPLVLVQPRSLSDALRRLHDDRTLVPLAGCTDVFVGLIFGTRRDERYLNIWAIDELRGISVEGNVLRIGATTTWRAIAQSRVVQRRVPMLVAAAHEIGSVQIQNRGTIGGNIANGSPAGDSLPVLAVAEALIELRSAEWTRTVPFTSFYTGYRRSVMRPGEIITAVEIPRISGEQWFRKVGTRAAQSISKVVMAAVRGDTPRVAFGSVAPTVIRVRRTEAALASGARLSEAQRLLREEITPIDDVRSTAAYRRQVAGLLLAQFWTETAGHGAAPRATTASIRRGPRGSHD
jgi:CO/xanthine dehydrogenase FAD-binding subunit